MQFTVNSFNRATGDESQYEIYPDEPISGYKSVRLANFLTKNQRHTISKHNNRLYMGMLRLDINGWVSLDKFTIEIPEGNYTFTSLGAAISSQADAALNSHTGPTWNYNANLEMSMRIDDTTQRCVLSCDSDLGRGSVVGVQRKRKR